MAGERILAIDDDRFFRTLYEDLLTQEGYQVSLAESGEAALAILEQEDFDLIITDMVMGGMNGIETLEAIKRRNPEQPVIMVTSEREIKIAVEALKKGAADYINKPVVEDEFKITVRRLLERRRLSEENAMLIEENLEQMRVVELVSRAQEIFFRVRPDRLPDYLLEFAMAETNATSGLVLLSDPFSGCFVVRAMQGFPSPFLEKGVEPGKGLLGSAIARGAPWIFQRAHLKGKEGARELEPLGDNNMLLPLREEEGIMGAILLSGKADGKPFTAKDITLLLTITPMAIFAIKKSLPSEKETRPEVVKVSGAEPLEDLIDQEIKKSQSYQRRFSILLVDLEEIKRWMRAPGWSHEKLMEEVTAALRKTVRAADTVSPVDERGLAVVIPETDYQGAITVSRRVYQALKDLFVNQELLVHPLFPLGMGIASFPEHGQSCQSLLDRARAGMGRIAEGYFRYEMIWEFVDRLLLEAERSEEVHRSLTPLTPGVTQAVDVGFGREVKYLENEREREILSQFIEEEVRDSLLGEGILYVGVSLMSNLKGRLEIYQEIQARGTKVFLFGSDDWLDWDPGEMTPVVARDADIIRHRFLLYYGVKASYGLMVRQKEDGSISGFFTTNAFLVNELMRKLKEIYL